VSLSSLALALGERERAIDFRHTLAQVIRMKTHASVQDDVFSATG
jgi:hypothetical protein